MASLNVSNSSSVSPTSKCSESLTNTSSPPPEADAEETSLQQLIESELALRIAAVKESPPEELLVGLQTDFFSTTQYESPSDEVPPIAGHFDPFATTVEQSPTFTGFSEEDIKSFNKTETDIVLTPTKDTTFISQIKTTQFDLLSNIEPEKTSNNSSPSPPSNCDLVQEIQSEMKSHVTVERECLQLTLDQSNIDLLTQSIEVSPSPPLDPQLEEITKQVVDPLSQTFDLSPTPPPDSQIKLISDISVFGVVNGESSLHETYDLSPSPPLTPKGFVQNQEILVDPINQTIDLSPSPPSAQDEMVPSTSPNASNEDVSEIIPVPVAVQIEEANFIRTPSPKVQDDVLETARSPILTEDTDFDIVTPASEIIISAEDPEAEVSNADEPEAELINSEEPEAELINVEEAETESINDEESDAELIKAEEAAAEVINTVAAEATREADSPSVEEDLTGENVEIVVTEVKPVMAGPHALTLEIDGFETWTVAGTEEEEEDAPPMQKSLLPERPTNFPHVVQITNDGDEIISPSSEEPASPSGDASPTKKKGSKKTKSTGDGTKVKKSKKTKKSEEKENISVTGLPSPDIVHETRSVKHEDAKEELDAKTPSSPMTLISREELGNVSVKNLSMTFARGPKATQLRSDVEELEGVSIRTLREMYISEASKQFNNRDKSTETLSNAVSISSLRRSFGDLSTLNDSDVVNGDRNISPACDAPRSPMIRKGYGTLPLPKTAKDKIFDERRLSSDENKLRANDLRNREPIITGVSVRALLASYCSVTQLKEDVPRSRKSSNVSTTSSPPPQAKSSFSKFDALSRKSGVLHVRSSDSAKAQQHFSQDNYPLYALLDAHENAIGTGDLSAPQQCRACGTQVFQMEQVKAEKSVWHKNCFRCKECNKQLTVDTYGSNEGQLYCKPHFKDLFKPKAVAIEEPALLRPRRLEMIIRENQPEELPPDVVRASDKPDLGLEELTQLNVKSRFQVFERSDESNEIERSSSNVNVKRSPSILSKLARFQAKGMDIGVTDDSLNGVPIEQSSSEEEESEEDEGEDAVVKARVKRERPMSFGKMDDVRSMWATGQAQRREEQREERKEEVQRLRSRLFMPTSNKAKHEKQGKCGKVKEMYEQAVQESSSTKTSSQQRAADVRSEKARSIKERFEKGELLQSDEEGDEQDNKKAKQEDMSVFEAGISKKSRSLFLELDSAAKSQQTPQTTPRSPVVKAEPRRVKEWLSREPSQEIVRSSDKVEEVEIQTSDISSRFKFFEGYREPEKTRKAFRITPPREGQVKEPSPDRPLYRDPEVVRAEDRVAEEELVRSQTASRMLNLFRQMEECAGREEVPEGPKPLKRFTPPPDYKKGDSGSSEEDSEEEDSEGEEEESDGEPTGIVRASDKPQDEFLKQALSANAARAKALKDKFEKWESPSKGHVNGSGRVIDPDDDDKEEDEVIPEGRESLESTSSLRARFESLSKQPASANRERPKVNRFVVPAISDECRACGQKLYPMERLEAGGNLYHRTCFRCQQCNSVLRLENFTVNQGNLYCLAHFKQLFIARGNYEEGFGKAAPTLPPSAGNPLD